MIKILTRKFWSKKKIIWGVIILIVFLGIGYFSFGRNNGSANIQTAIAQKQNLEQTVLSTGQVVSAVDLALSFQTGGKVRQVLVKEGDQVKAGQTLAYLDQSSAQASLTSAQGTLDQAKANYEKLLAGATQEDVKTYQDAVISAEHDLSSSYEDAINTLQDAYTKMLNAYNTVVSLQKTYFSLSDQQGIKVSEGRDKINDNLQNAKLYLDAISGSSDTAGVDSALTSFANNLIQIFNALSVIRNACDEGVYYTNVSSTDKTSVDTQKGYINTASTSVTTAKQAIGSYRIALQKAQNNLNLRKTPPTKAELDLANAQILSAQGQVDSALALLSNSIIQAPESGTITEVSIKVGQQAIAMQNAIVLQNVSELHSEANISEANIAYLATGQAIDYTFDALGPNSHFAGTVLTINPASTIVSGVVNYKVTGSLAEIPNIKPGMTANMTILVTKKDDVLAVPSSAVINKNDSQYIRVIDDKKTKTFHEVQVQTGLQADGGLVEILSGISEGQEIVTYIKL